MQASGSAGNYGFRPDILATCIILPKDILEKLLAPLHFDSALIASRVGAAKARIEGDPTITERQKQDLQRMLEWSPNPAYTAQRLRKAEDLNYSHGQWATGFQFFKDGGRGKKNQMMSQSSITATSEAAQWPSAEHSTSARGNQSAEGTPAKSRRTFNVQDEPLPRPDAVEQSSQPALEIGDAMPDSALMHAKPGSMRQSVGGQGATSGGSQCPILGAKRRGHTNSTSPAAKKVKLNKGGTARSETTDADSVARSGAFAMKLRKRNGERCEVTGAAGDDGEFIPQGAHIFGLATARKFRSGFLWDLFMMFWDSNVVDELQEACRAGVNHLSNGILMDIKAHRTFDNLHYYLEVMPDSYQVTGNKAQYSVVVRFPRGVKQVINLGNTSFRTNDGDPLWCQMKDGDVITFKTTDQKRYPLPDAVLLHVRGILTQCAFFSAAGEGEDVYLHNEWRREQMRAKLQSAMFDKGDHTFSEDGYTSGDDSSDDDYLYDDKHPTIKSPGAEHPGNWVESWLESIDFKRNEAEWGCDDDTRVEEHLTSKPEERPDE